MHLTITMFLLLATGSASQIQVSKHISVTGPWAPRTACCVKTIKVQEKCICWPGWVYLLKICFLQNWCFLTCWSKYHKLNWISFVDKINQFQPSRNPNNVERKKDMTSKQNKSSYGTRNCPSCFLVAAELVTKTDESWNKFWLHGNIICACLFLMFFLKYDADSF